MNIKEIVTQIEGRRLEFKEVMPARSDLSKTVVAFANDAGGEKQLFALVLQTEWLMRRLLQN